MNFEHWLTNRRKPGTIEYLVRSMCARGYKYSISIGKFKIMLLAEMFIANGGSLSALAEQIGIHRNTIYRLFNGADFDTRRLAEVAKAEKDEPK